jgi:hypothetical protein
MDGGDRDQLDGHHDVGGQRRHVRVGFEVRRLAARAADERHQADDAAAPPRSRLHRRGRRALRCMRPFTTPQSGFAAGASRADDHARRIRMPSKQYARAPEMQIDPTKRYEAIFHTDKGDFTVELFAKEAPVTVNNFVFLARAR